ncbi:hypothetical protein [Spirulina subsalsa]|nr:hypothetical protein [Spirulina subsalsa]
MWLRIPGDIMFAIGAVVLIYCVAQALFGIFQQPTQAQPTDALVTSSSAP